MRAFIIRPFGTQQDINFDRVESRLIKPALARLRELGIDIDGGTTGEIAKAGNIREDMFRLIAVSDLVIADVTIHNANAFYELGIRHALCPEHTHLLRAKKTEHKYPFDLQTDRYFNYDLDKLKGDIEALAQALKATLASERDSPIFSLLRNLRPHGRGHLLKVPDDFREEVERAKNGMRRGDLRLLAHECASFEWDQEGLQLVGDAQFKLRAFEGAKDTFELLRRAVAKHQHANWRLGTTYQRLALEASGARKEELATMSEQAIQRALSVATTVAEQAEQHSLLGSNAKNRWIDDYRCATGVERQRRALESPWLETMLQHYMRASGCDLNAHYPAVNMLAFLKAQIVLAGRFPDSWAGLHDDDAEGKLRQRVGLVERVVGNLRLSLRLDNVFKCYQNPADSWAASSIADVTLITSPDKGPAIKSRYRTANAGADRFSLEANRRNLDIFKELDLFEPGVSAALSVIDNEIEKHSPPDASLERVLLFSGHMVDALNRAPDKVRFPRTAKAEKVARQLIEEAVRTEVGDDAHATLGIAGGACGGDILFHEVCADLGIRTELFLPAPERQFQRESVERGGSGWVTRFQDICRTKPPRILQGSLALPAWLAAKPDYSVWERNNLWMLFNTLATRAPRQTLIALVNDEREADGPGGTKHLLKTAHHHGLKNVPIDARPLLQ